MPSSEVIVPRLKGGIPPTESIMTVSPCKVEVEASCYPPKHHTDTTTHPDILYLVRSSEKQRFISFSIWSHYRRAPKFEMEALRFCQKCCCLLRGAARTS